MNLQAGLEDILLYCVGIDGYHSEYAVTPAVMVVSGGIPSSITEVESDCDMHHNCTKDCEKNLQ